MKEPLFKRALCIVLFLALISQTVSAFAAATNPAAPFVHITIESHDRTLAEGQVNAYSFQEAVKNLGIDASLSIIYAHDGKKNFVYSVNGVKQNQFGQSDGWLGYVERNGNVVNPEDYLSFQLEPGDRAVLYYGHPENTKIIPSLQYGREANSVRFLAQSTQTLWSAEDGSWRQEQLVEGVKDLRIRIRFPGGTQKIFKTNDEGVANATFSVLGAYSFYAEGYVNGSYPRAVRTPNQVALFGLKNNSRATRGEVAAFIANSFHLSNDAGTIQFTDVTNLTPYQKEILYCASTGIISGYADGRFMPDEPVTQLQLAVMLSRLLPEASEPGKENLPNVPAWAVAAVNTCLSAGAFDGMNPDWNGTVTAEQLAAIYQNLALYIQR